MTTPTLYNKTVTIEFEKLSYFASSSSKKSGQQPILDNVNGRFRPGYLAAILGPSGAGKTSLLNVLSGFKGNGSSVKGKILVNGRQRILQEFRKQSCYIRQEVAMHQLLTVKETFQIAACFKLSRKTSAAQRDRIVNDVAEILGLQSVMNSQVIFLSGGEKKRVSIGVELMNNPPVMFFDEPTSGLDSSSSYIVMKHLNSLAAKGRTVLVVIHQPSSRIFELIDDIYLLSKGSCLYNGPSKYLVETLAASNFHCPMYYNRSDFAIEVACNEREGNLESLKIEAENQFKQRKGEFYCDSPESLCNPSEDTCEHMAMLINEDESVLKNCDEDHMKKGSVIHHYPISRLQQFCLLFKRCLLCTGRNYQLAHIRVAMHILVAILLGFLYYDFGDDGDKVIGNFSFVFFIVLFIFFASAMPTVLTFPLEANVFLLEHLNNWYSVTVYYFAKVLADLPLQIICPTLFLMISYSLTGQPLEFNRMFMLWLVCVLIAILGQTLGNTFGAILDVQFAVFVVPASSIPMFLLSGYFQRPKDLSSVFRSLSYTSYFKYAFEAALLSLFGYNRERLKCSEPYCHYRSTSKFLADTGVQDFCYWERLSALVGWIIGLQLLLYFTLKWKVYKSKR